MRFNSWYNIEVKILLTGAHFTPAQAVIEELQQSKDRLDLIYIGRKYTREGDSSVSVESQVLPKLGVKFISITAGRVRRDFSFYTLTALLKIPLGFVQGFRQVLKIRPNMVLSFGGYVALPVVFAAWILRIPILVHEQTLISGLSNSISNFFATKVAVSFKKAYSFDKKKLMVTGNPLRKELFKARPSKSLEDFIAAAKKQKKHLVYITGGNQGSHIINEAASEVLSELTDQFFVIHQTGDSKFADFEKLVESQKKLVYPERYLVSKWVESREVGYIFQNADIAVSRAGANTLLELATFGVPSIIIPIPYVLKDEQTINAKYFANLGLAQILKQDNLNGESLLFELKKIEANLTDYKKQAANAKSVVIPNAAQILAEEAIRLGQGYAR